MNCSIVVHADHKLENIAPRNLSRVSRKQVEDPLNKIELHHFNSVNGSIAFVGVYASPIAAFVSSHLQQKRICAKVKDIATQ